MKDQQKQESGNSYSRRISSLRSSCVRELMSQIDHGDLVNFAAGQPDPALFPNEVIAKISSDVLSNRDDEPLQYSATEGFRPLREFIASRVLGEMGITACADEILLTNGSQQGLDLLGKVFFDPGDKVLLEAPSYMSAIQIFELYQARMVTTPMWEDGPEINDFRWQLDKHSPKAYYTVSNFHNPTGVTPSLRNRKQVADLLDRNDILVFEDDPYGLIRFDGSEKLPSITALRGKSRSILMGSFSKILAPALRIGWMYSSSETIKKLALAKQASDLCSSQFTQRIAWKYFCHTDINSHLKVVCEAYQRRRDWMIECLEKYMPECVRYQVPGGGMFMWLILPPEISASELLKNTLKRGVAFVPGGAFFAESPIDSAMRLNFAYQDRRSTEAGIAVIAEELQKLFKKLL